MPRTVQEGHDALAEGAAAVLIDRKFARLALYDTALVVPDLADAIGALGKSARRRSEAQIVAVAGGLGKSTLAGILGSALIGQSPITHLDAFDDQSLRRAMSMLPENGVACLELHARAPGLLAQMIGSLRPAYLAVVPTAPRFLDRFADTKAMAEDMAKAIRALPKGAHAALPVDEDHWALLRKSLPRHIHAMTYGTKPSAHHRAVDAHFHGGVTTVRARGWRTPMLLKLGGEGIHFASLALGALTMVRLLGYDSAMGIIGISGWRAQAGYGRHRAISLDAQLTEETLHLIDASLHSDPYSLRANIESLARQPGDTINPPARRIAVLGPMPGLGDQLPKYLGQIGAQIAASDIDLVHRVGAGLGPLDRYLLPGQKGAEAKTARDLLPQLRRLWRRGDIVLVQGDRDAGLDRVVDAMRKLGHRRRKP